jgi:hypothetical protein
MEGSPVASARHSVVVSLGCPDESLPRHNVRLGRKDLIIHLSLASALVHAVQKG